MANESRTTLEMKRHFDVSTELLFDAWTCPEMMKKWLMTTEATNTVAENDARVGGHWTIADHRQGKDYKAVGEYVELSRPNRIVFTFQMPQFSESIDRLIVDIAPQEQGSEMTFTQTIVVPHEEGWTEADIAKALEEYRSGSEHGWSLMFGGLKDILALYPLIQHIGAQKVAVMDDAELKNAVEDHFKEDNEQALASLRYLGYFEHDADALTPIGLQLIRQLTQHLL
jgi:uncharacterized protein YndB with AHSA1/START domain